MSIIREPEGIDFAVEKVKQTKADRELITKVLAHYKATGKKLKVPHQITAEKKYKENQGSLA